MACDSDELGQNIENLKASVRKSFARVYASLKARELKTLRQLDAIRKQCQDNKETERNCVQNIKVCYNDEPNLLDIISKYGVIDFEKLCFDNSTFILEDYISPNDDHMYLYKTIEEISDKQDVEDLEAIEEAALKQITETEDCVCIVTVNTEEVSRKFQEVDSKVHVVPKSNNIDEYKECKDTKIVDIKLDNIIEDEKNDCSDADVKKINPTDDWLNSIKNQTETEPTQVTDVMEHSTIACS